MSGEDARLDLWEALCTCGGARKSPDVRMCNCLAPEQAGLVCDGCGVGVLLIKASGTTGHLFWGCSMYKKGGCHFTHPFGPPHDRAAAIQMQEIIQDDEAAKRKLDYKEEEDYIVDVHEQQWRGMCRCEGADHLITIECYMQSEGGCGLLPECPQCGAALFLKNGRNGMYWKCRQVKSRCGYTKTYQQHATEQERSSKRFKATTPATDLASATRLQDSSNDPVLPPSAKMPDPDASTELSPKQKALIEARRQAALARLKTPPRAGRWPGTDPTPDATFQSPVPSLKLGATLTPEQRTKIDANRKAALVKLKSPPRAGRWQNTESTPNQSFESPSSSSLKRAATLAPDQRTKIDANRAAALDKLKRDKSPPKAPYAASARTDMSFQSPQRKLSSNRTASMFENVSCVEPNNEPLYRAFLELLKFYREERNYNAAQTYLKVSQAIHNLPEAVTPENALSLGKGKTKVAHIGKASAQKMLEFVTTGSIGKLEEKRAIH